MNYYFAPLEGITDSVYRRLHRKYFPGPDAYYMPFFSPTVHRSLTPRERRELPAATEDFRAVPQLLTRSPEDFLWAAEQCRALGYDEVNLNLGCPSGTVTAKGKGAGMLADPEGLDRFLDAVFSKTPLPISVKTRLGMTDPAEFPPLLDIFNRYPIRLLILHPRVRKAFYAGKPDLEAFAYLADHCRCPICCNGDLCSLEDIQGVARRFPGLDAVMLGRGLVGDPGMLSPGGTTPEVLEEFYQELLEQYLVLFGGSRNAMFRLKEHWRYLLCRFQDSGRLGRRLRKASTLEQYRAITAEIFHTLPLAPRLEPDW